MKGSEANRQQESPGDDETAEGPRQRKGPKTSDHTKAKPEPSANPTRPGHKPNAAPVRELVKPINVYLGEHPDGRSKTTEKLRKEVSLIPR